MFAIIKVVIEVLKLFGDLLRLAQTAHKKEVKEDGKKIIAKLKETKSLNDRKALIKSLASHIDSL